MEILIAYFGKAPKYINVTSRVKQDVCNGVLNASYTWHDLGDPCRDIPKELTIIYSDCGELIIRVFPETGNDHYMTVNLPSKK